MKITSISYQAVKNLGNYESERLEATATVGEDESAMVAVRQLRAFVHTQLTESPDILFENDLGAQDLITDPDLPEGF